MRLERSAVTGLLLVCGLLAAGLGVTTVHSYRAAQRAARSVLHSRAVEVANSVGAVARMMPPPQSGDFAKLAQEFGTDEIGVAICDLRGRVLAASGGPAPQLKVGSKVSIWTTIKDLRVQGQASRLLKAAGGDYLEHWQPIRGPRPHAGRGRGPGRWQKRGGFRRGMGWRKRLKLVRVTVSARVADELTSPARFALVLAGGAAGLLLILGVVMFRAAGRARRTQRELQRRRALASLGEMAAVLAHEIRTPLASIKGNAQLFGEAHADDERIDAVVLEAGRLERLVDGLLDYARPAAPRRAKIDPDELAERAAGIVAPKAEAASVTLMTDPAQSGSCLSADSDQLIQVLVNLLQNGVEACERGPNGTRSVVLRVRRARGKVTFSVLDSGPGFEDGAQLEQLVRPFFSTKQRGTGLGLSVARQIVEQHGGQLRLEQRKEGGARVEVVLPLHGGKGGE